MFLGLLAAIALAPVYWLVVPPRWRRDVIAAASLLALGLYDPRLPVLLLVCTLGLAGALRAIATGDTARRRAFAAVSVALIVALFVWNKRAGGGLNVLASQSGVLFLGVSYLVLKMAGAIIDGTRGTLGPARARDLLAWLVFLPTYPSGPIENFAHFRDQSPAWDQRRTLGGLERVLFGLVKSQVFALQLGAWIDPILAAPASASPPVLLLALYALLLRFYFDLAGYSDIAIGLAALYGYDIAENFDRPFAARNLAQFWQRWHITLTGWLRTYVFTLVTRPLLRRMAGHDDRLAIVTGILITLVLVGTWHGLHWNFVLYGFLHGLGVVWVSVYARDCGRWLLPAGTVRWWRQSRTGYLLSVALTFNTCALLGVFAVHDIGSAVRYLLAMIGQ
jgi:alginate O-acetyltransferase complex protein AlgI